MAAEVVITPMCANNRQFGAKALERAYIGLFSHCRFPSTSQRDAAKAITIQTDTKKQMYLGTQARSFTFPTFQPTKQQCNAPLLR